MGSVTEGKSKNKTFKKRAHRPWHTHLLDEVLEESSNVVDATTIIQDKQCQENQHELSQRQWQAILDIKEKEHEHLSTDFNALDNNRVTIGGFFRPKEILMVMDPLSLQKSTQLMHELKAKEFEIHSIAQHLKLSAAEECAKHAEASRLSEEKARVNAEEKALFALRQAQMAAEQLQKTEEKAKNIDNLRLTLEADVIDLKDQLQTANQELELLGQKALLDAEQRYRIEQDLRSFSVKLKEQQHHSFSLEEEKKALMLKWEAENRKVIENESALQRALQKITDLEHLFDATKADYEQSLTNEQETQHFLKQTEQDLLTKLQTLSKEKEALMTLKGKQEIALATANTNIAKLQEVVTLERNLRKIFEDRLQEALGLLEQSKSKRRPE